MILIDAVYIHNFGGKSIIVQMIQGIIARKLNLDNFYFLLDNRIKIDHFLIINHKYISPSHAFRKNFYKKNKSDFSSIVCLANVPPPLKTKIPTSIYFHNILLINPLTYKIPFKSKIFNLLKFIYIDYYNSSNYNWIVQTSLVNKLINKHLNVQPNKIFDLPVFEETRNLKSNLKKKKTFLYISSNVYHKNHKRLIDAFIRAAKLSTKNIILNLTISKYESAALITPDNLKINFLGTLSKIEVSDLYSQSFFLIYSSLFESFGLPLIEAVQHGCKVIASDLPYVHEIIEPSLTFDPYSVESISTSILKAISEDLPKTKVLVENKLDNFIDFIISQDVQQ
jgi:glycosyltransferase involved in cell wall biosynthesis